ncbi:rhomboid family intramembrane serine protease [Streptococcus merionis]|uniref:rhomboid family intramembrane serine protease n=1 Tax=Streptococcus merionis TaxID=400065 RepID=UPI0035127F38
MNQTFSRRYPVTTGILAITWLVFLAMQVLRFGWATSAQSVFDFGGMYGRAIEQDPSQLWRLVTPIFVHIGWQHILLNSLSIYFLGQQLEGLFGSLKFALFYLLSGIMGNALGMFLTPDTVSAGASTSIFGLFASLAMLRYIARSPYIRALGQSYMGLLIFNLIFGLITPGIGNAGHIGGAIGGALAVVFIPIRGEEGIFSSAKRHLALMAYLVLLIGMICFRIF